MDQQRRLLPQMLEDRLMGLFARLGGIVLALLLTAAWISLLSWSAADPSLTHATSGATRNLLGPLGAIAGDLLLQTLGLAAVFTLLAPMLWSIELVLRERVQQLRVRAVLYPISVLLLAGALSSLPVPDTWPLRHGFGGIVGDGVFSLLGGVLASVSPARAGLVAGLVLFAAGFAAATKSLGQELSELPRLLSGDSGGTGVLPSWSAISRRLRAGARAGGGDAPDPGFRPAEGVGFAPAWSPEPAGGAAEYAQHAPAPEGHGMSEPVRPAAGFDAHTDAGSRSIAERFAPAGGDLAGHPTLPGLPAQRKSGFLAGLAIRRAEPQYRRPSLNLLKRPPAAKPGPEFTQAVLRGNARLLEDVLADFGIKGEVKDIKPGPVVTVYELEPARGTKSARVIGLADDIARSMSAASARVAVVPGRNAIGIELPNIRRETVYLREVLEDEQIKSAEMVLPLALGRSIAGGTVAIDLARLPHLLVAGTTGSGKSTGVNAMIMSLLYRHPPEECRLLMIDPKMLELSVYNGVPHLLSPVITEPAKAVAALEWAVSEMDERYKRMSKLSVRSIDVYNNRVRHALKQGERMVRTVQTGFDAKTGQAIYEREELDLEPMPYIVVVVDELADLMIASGKDIEGAVQRLAQMSRAAGIHLILATQRPSVDVLTATIKACFPSRIAYRVASKIDSRTILDEQGAEQLLGQGDMLFSTGASQIARVHGAFVSDEEIEAVAAHLRQQGEPRYVEGLTEPRVMEAPQSQDGDRAEAADEIYEKAVAMVLRDRKPSTSYLQRRLAIGYNRAADLIERMERARLVSPPDGAGKREILDDGSTPRGSQG